MVDCTKPPCAWFMFKNEDLAWCIDDEYLNFIISEDCISINNNKAVKKLENVDEILSAL